MFLLERMAGGGTQRPGLVRTVNLLKRWKLRQIPPTELVSVSQKKTQVILLNLSLIENSHVILLSLPEEPHVTLISAYRTPRSVSSQPSCLSFSNSVRPTEYDAEPMLPSH